MDELPAIKPEPKIHTDDDFDAEQDKKDEYLFDELSPLIDTIRAECEHTPDILDLIDMDYRCDEVICRLKCQCGKTIEERFTHHHTNVCE